MSLPSAEQPKTVVTVGDDAQVNVFHLAGQSQQRPVILFLQPNGFHIKCHAPLATCLAPHALCIGIEFRGQGGTPAPDPAEQLVEAYLHDLFAVMQALEGLQGCYCFGHSGGGQVAIAAEARHPGTFVAIYAYEPVLYSPPSKDSVKTDLTPAYLALAAAARRRKAHFQSKEAAEKRLRPRPPYASFRKDAWKAFTDNNLTILPDGSCTLTCSPENEARWYLEAGRHSIEPLHHMIPKVQCPVRLALGHGGQMHFLLLAAEAQVHRFVDAQLERFPNLDHLGPMEDPSAVAAHVWQFFQHCHQLPSSESGSRAKL